MKLIAVQAAGCAGNDVAVRVGVARSATRERQPAGSTAVRRGPVH